MISVERAAAAACGVARKPWDYRVTVALPHVNTPETLPLVLDLLHLQTVSPYVLLIDTGSSHEHFERLHDVWLPRRTWCEPHCLHPAGGFRHTSAHVTAALDVAFALCRSEYLFLTHTDVFPKRRDLIAWLLAHATDETGACINPVVGYEMSRRPGTERWRNVVSHTCTLLHMPTMRRHGVSWSFERYWESGAAEAPIDGYPDTEQPFDLCIRQAGIYPRIIGHEPNDHYEDENFEHVRSWTGLKMYQPNSPLYATRYRQLHWAMQKAQSRIITWKEQA